MISLNIAIWWVKCGAILSPWRQYLFGNDEQSCCSGVIHWHICSDETPDRATSPKLLAGGRRLNLHPFGKCKGHVFMQAGLEDILRYGIYMQCRKSKLHDHYSASLPSCLLLILKQAKPWSARAQRVVGY